MRRIDASLFPCLDLDLAEICDAADHGKPFLALTREGIDGGDFIVATFAPGEATPQTTGDEEIVALR